MDSTNFFTDSQAQWSEMQKKAAEFWNQSQNQWLESQKKIVDAWMGTIPSETPQGAFAANYEKVLNSQRELINSVIDAQQVTFQYAVESQKQFWESYFQAAQQVMQQTISK